MDSDYREELFSYKTITDERCEPDSWSAIARNERFNRYWQAMQSGKLRREKLVLFLSKRIDANPPATTNKTAVADHYRRILAQYNEAFDQHRRVIASLFEPHGCAVSAMSTENLFRYYATFLNPSYLKRDNYDPIGQFQEDESVHQNCWHQGVQAGRNFGFFADGFYHNLVILKRRPQRTRRGIFWALTSLPFLDYTITVNLYPQQYPKGDRQDRKVAWSACVATTSRRASIPCSRRRKSKNSASGNSPRATPHLSNTISSFTFGTEPKTG